MHRLPLRRDNQFVTYVTLAAQLSITPLIATLACSLVCYWKSRSTNARRLGSYRSFPLFAITLSEQLLNCDYSYYGLRTSLRYLRAIRSLPKYQL
jgi:hypothetical protein